MNDDTISRKAAIDTVMKFMPSLTTPDGCGQFDKEIYEAQEMFVDIGQALNDLPSAERRGRWIEEYSANHFQAKCSACGESTLYGITYDLEGNAYYMNYCPNCGARMVEDGTD